MCCEMCCVMCAVMSHERGRPHEAGVGTRKAIAVSHGLGGIFFSIFHLRSMVV